MFKKFFLTLVVLSTFFATLPVRAEDFIPPVQRLGTGLPTSIAASPDGKTLAVGSSIGVWLLDANTLQPTGFWDTEAWVITVEYSTDGKYLKANNTVLDATNGSKVNLVVGQVQWINHRCSLDGILCVQLTSNPYETSNFDSHFLVTDRITKVDVALIKQWYVHDIAWSPDGIRLFTTSGASKHPQVIKAWDTATWKPIKESSGFFNSERQEVWWTPDGRTVFANGTYWNVASGQTTKVVNCRNYGLLKPECDPSPIRAWRSWVYAFNVATGTQLRYFIPHSKGLSAAQVSSDQTLLVTSGAGAYNHCDPTICSNTDSTRIWSTTNFANLGEIPTAFRAVTFSPDHYFLFGADRGVQAWDWKGAKLLWSLERVPSCTGLWFWQWIDYYGPDRYYGELTHEQCIAASQQYVAFSPESTTASTYTVELHSVTNGDLVATLTGHTAPITGVAFSPDGSQLAASSGDGTVLIWNVP